MAMGWLALQMAYAEEEKNKNRKLRLYRRRLRDEQDPFDLPDRMFLSLFRISKHLAKDISQELREYLEGDRSDSLPAEIQILCAVRFYAVGSYQRAIGQDFLLAVSQTMVSCCIKKVTSAINDHLLMQWIRFPATSEERAVAKTQFGQFAQPFPGAIGVIDCTHISILGPKDNEEAFVNHKGFHSLNVQIICDTKKRIINVNARHPGQRHDSAIWNQSAARTLMEMCYADRERKTWLIGDSGYALEPWMMTPITNAVEGTPQYRYTEALCATRSLVERCYGNLKSVFRCLSKQRVLMYTPNNASKIVNACCVLQNMRIEYNIFDEPEEEPIAEEEDVVCRPPSQDECARVAEGGRVQAQLIRDHFSN